jgi:hypothetical protein
MKQVMLQDSNLKGLGYNFFLYSKANSKSIAGDNVLLYYVEQMLRGGITGGVTSVANKEYRIRSG